MQSLTWHSSPTDGSIIYWISEICGDDEDEYSWNSPINETVQLLILTIIIVCPSIYSVNKNYDMLKNCYSRASQVAMLLDRLDIKVTWRCRWVTRRLLSGKGISGISHLTVMEWKISSASYWWHYWCDKAGNTALLM